MIGKRFGRLVVREKTDKRKNGKIVWMCECDCGNITYVSTIYLNNGDTRSCGCLKKELEQKHLRDEYDSKRIDGVAMHLFDDKPRKDSSTGYRGVSRYYTRVSKQERYRAWITVNGKRYYKSGFTTAEDAYYKGRLYAEDAYYKGRLYLEQKYLPKKDDDINDK